MQVTGAASGLCPTAHITSAASHSGSAGAVRGPLKVMAQLSVFLCCNFFCSAKMGFRFPLTVVCLALSIRFGFYPVKGITAKPSIPASQRHVEKLASQLLLQHTPRSRQTSAFLFFFFLSCSFLKGSEYGITPRNAGWILRKREEESERVPLLPSPSTANFHSSFSDLSLSLGRDGSATFSHSSPGQSFDRRRQCEWSSGREWASLVLSFSSPA